MGVYEELQARGLIAQVTDEEEIRELVNNGKAVFYIGFDPTADSLHVGHFVAMMVMAHIRPNNCLYLPQLDLSRLYTEVSQQCGTSFFARHLLEKLPGQKFLIQGNHDGSIRAYSNYRSEVR